ncbi:MAG: hypothetical protein J6Y48_01045, partial [Clostridia bacterium]|nr:hypothetical protein [Clostridia bacterium]
MRIDTFGLPVQIQHGGEVKKMIPPSFRRPNKAEAREQEMEKLRRICGCKGLSDEEMEEMAPRIWKRFVRTVGWETEEE